MLRFTRSSRKGKKAKAVDWQKAPDIEKRAKSLIKSLNIDWVDSKRLHFFRSSNSSSRAYARIWGLNKIWQKALVIDPNYVIEVLSQHFDKLPDWEKDKVLLHEIAHIPKNFSGSLLPHIRRRGKRNFHDRVEELYSQYMKSKRDK